MESHASTRRDYDAIKPLLKAGYQVRFNGRTGIAEIFNPTTGDRRSVGNLPRRGGLQRAGWLFTEQRLTTTPTESPETRRRRNLRMDAAIARINHDRIREMDRLLSHYAATQ